MNTLIRSSVVMLVCGLYAGSANANWPTDPSTPLVVGTMENAFSPRQSIAITDDGAAWFAWQDSFCVGQVRAQRVAFNGSLLTSDGFPILDDPSCGFQIPPLVQPLGNDVVMSMAFGSPLDFPIQRLENDGNPLWEDGYSTTSPVTIGGITQLVSGDILVVTHASGFIYAQRIDDQGNEVWNEKSIVVEGISSNLRILNIIPHPDGGAYVFWDSHLSYTKLIYASRILADGSRAWTQPTRMVEPPPSIPSSRHTTPVVVPDGKGGATLIFTVGFETGTTPAPLLMQHLNPDGSLSFSPEGARVSLGTARQFYPNVQTDPATGDLFILWMDGQTSNATVRA